jgi:hypothetical protein
MRKLTFAPLTLLTACSDLGGNWLGSCEFGDARYGYSSAVTLDITEGQGTRILGDLQVDMYDGRIFLGDVEGTKGTASLDLEGTVREEGSEEDYFFNMDGKLDGEETELVGSCEFGIPGGTGSLIGDLKIER